MSELVEHLLVRLKLVLISNRVPSRRGSVGMSNTSIISVLFAILLRQLFQTFQGVEMRCDRLPLRPRKGLAVPKEGGRGSGAGG